MTTYSNDIIILTHAGGMSFDDVSPLVIELPRILETPRHRLYGLLSPIANYIRLNQTDGFTSEQLREFILSSTPDVGAEWIAGVIMLFESYGVKGAMMRQFACLATDDRDTTQRFRDFTVWAITAHDFAPRQDFSSAVFAKSFENAQAHVRRLTE